MELNETFVRGADRLLENEAIKACYEFYKKEGAFETLMSIGMK